MLKKSQIGIVIHENIRTLGGIFYKSIVRVT